MNNDDIFELIKERVESGHEASLVVTGKSMAPLFKDGKTTVTLAAPKLPLRKHGIYLYKRQNGQVVLHRAVSVHKDTADFRGDAERVTERAVPFFAIIACAVAAETDGKKKKLCGARQSLYGTCRKAVCFLSRFKASLIAKAFKSDPA